MITYKKSTVFNANADAIVNTVNCEGVMGAGLALEFSLRYPDMFNKYKEECKEHLVEVGKLNTYKDNGVLIINFPTKKSWRYPSEVIWIKQGLEYLKEHYKEYNIKSIAIPPLGCSNGGLNFERQVKPLIESILKDIDLDIIICIDPGYPEGKEKEMVDTFKKYNIETLSDVVKLNENQKKSLSDGQTFIKRFYEIKSLDKIGKTTYSKLFEYFYKDNKEVYIQQSLF